ncbi:hypothetical protein AAG570_008061 [Ranatra chinensis]|uniref:Uncharacterized protein n=1 Tax=Ranatra chinensis TaxID=642074 RepID=A0ABD0Y8X4_9HEMI
MKLLCLYFQWPFKTEEFVSKGFCCFHVNFICWADYEDQAFQYLPRLPVFSTVLVSTAKNEGIADMRGVEGHVALLQEAVESGRDHKRNPDLPGPVRLQRVGGVREAEERRQGSLQEASHLRPSGSQRVPHEGSRQLPRTHPGLRRGGPPLRHRHAPRLGSAQEKNLLQARRRRCSPGPHARPPLPSGQLPAPQRAHQDGEGEGASGTEDERRGRKERPQRDGQTPVRRLPPGARRSGTQPGQTGHRPEQRSCRFSRHIGSGIL